MSTFDTPSPISATIDIVFGDIRVVAADRADTVVEVRPLDASRPVDVAAAEQVVIDFADGRLSVRHSKLRTAFTTKFGAVRVTVALPTGSDVRGTTTEGECRVQGLVGTCRLRSTLGDIRVGQAAELRLRTTSGRITVDRVCGRADVRGNDDIHIRRSDGDVVLRNTGGDTRLDEVGGGTVDLYAALGNLDIGIAADTAVRLDADAPVGRVLEHVETAGPRHRVAMVRARSELGDIIVHSARIGRDRR